jgi:uncharacterized membrane-anchored protein
MPGVFFCVANGVTNITANAVIFVINGVIVSKLICIFGGFILYLHLIFIYIQISGDEAKDGTVEIEAKIRRTYRSFATS